MDEQDLTKYQKQLCRIIIEKRCKHQSMFECVLGTVEIVDDKNLYITDSKDSRFKIPKESIRGIHVNDEQW